MIVNSSAIVLSTLRYSDHSVILKAYTEVAGLRTFMVRTGKGRAASAKHALLQPLTLLRTAFRSQSGKSMEVPRMIERETLFKHIPTDPLKSCIAIFMTEVISRSIKEEEQNVNMFRFLHDAVVGLDRETASVANFHLKFMLEFSRHLGFYPHHQADGQSFFDLTEGGFVVAEPAHRYSLNTEEASLLQQLMHIPFELHHTVKMDNDSRRQILQNMIDYFRLHLPGMQMIISHHVLEEALA